MQFVQFYHVALRPVQAMVYRYGVLCGIAYEAVLCSRVLHVTYSMCRTDCNVEANIACLYITPAICNRLLFRRVGCMRKNVLERRR